MTEEELYIGRAFYYFTREYSLTKQKSDELILRMFFDRMRSKLGKIKQIFEEWKNGKTINETYINVFLKKTCTKCKQIKDKSEFDKQKSNKDGVGSKCKKCRSEIEAIKRKDPKHKQRVANWHKSEIGIQFNRKQYLKKKYKITTEDYNAMAKEQNGVCKICGEIPKQRASVNYKFKNNFCIDHDHKTGLVRGLLCHTCNLMIGGAKDSIEVLLNAIEYLKEHGIKTN